MQTLLICFIVLEMIAIINIEILASSLRWIDRHPAESLQIARDHDYQDRLEGR